MRFFLKIKQNGKQVGLKRIESKHELAHTDQLLALISKSLGIDCTTFIVRFTSDQNKFRLVAGWPLSQYSVRSGLQMEVELLTMAKQHVMEDVQASGHEQLGQVQFAKPEMGKIIEEDEEDGGRSTEFSHMVEKKYEELLKMIQKNNTQGYIKQVNADCTALGACENQFYRKELRNIQNELGAQGWAAIHYAVFANNIEIVNFLIGIGVDVNTKTSDEWLPIQLAVREQNHQMIDILVAQPALNINICTAHGLVLNMAVQSMNRPIIEKLLMKDANFSARDHLGRTVYDVLGPSPDKELGQMLSKEERRQSITNIISEKNVMYHALISSFRGQVLCVRTPPRKSKDYYLCINPYENAIKIYEQKAHYPQFPKQLIPITLTNKFKQLSKSQRSWYMKSELFYFIVASPKVKYIFGCHFQQTVGRWITAFGQCQEHVNKYPDSIKQFQRNDNVVIDRIQEESKANRRKVSSAASKEALMSLFTSKCSERTEESPEKVTRVNTLDVKKEIKVEAVEKQSPKIEKTKASQTSTTSTESQTQMPSKNGLKFTDFKIIKTLGQGSFGTVFLATDLRNPQKHKKYALKCFKKKKLVVNKQIKYTVAQLNILKQLSHPFIVNLHFTFQTPNYVYLGLDYCPNKDMSHHLMNEVTFPEREAMLYAAEILLAIQYLHEKNIIYRDLKPENIMLDGEGHVRLVDFGLSKQGQDQDRAFVARSFCGSPAYLSPEMLVKKGVGKESDFYCLGAVLYEMLVGQPPFFSDDIATLYLNISNSKLTFPKSMSNEAKSLLTGLLQRDPQKRLGYRGAQQIKSHSFFRDINWNSLLKKSIKAPVREQIQAEQQDDSLVVQSSHKDFDYSAENYRINRFLNFSFVREENGENANE